MSLCTDTQESQQPHISIPNQTKGSVDDEKELLNSESQKKSTPKKVHVPVNKEASTGWFGGIWRKLALRPKNQMKLPDDTNPSVCRSFPYNLKIAAVQNNYHNFG